MERMTDDHIRQSLKNWAMNQTPPENGRARLLLVAAVTSVGGHPATEQSPDHRLPVEAVRNRLPMFQTSGSFYQPLLWVMHLTMSPLKNVT